MCVYLKSTVKMGRSTLGHTKNSEWHLVEFVATANGETKAPTGAEQCHLEKHCATPVLVLMLLHLLMLMV